MRQVRAARREQMDRKVNGDLLALRDCLVRRGKREKKEKPAKMAKKENMARKAAGVNRDL